MNLNIKQRLAVYAGLSIIAVGITTAADTSSASAQTVVHTFPGVQCDAVLGTTHLTQTQDVTVGINAPDSVAPGATFTVTFPGGSAALPNKSNGLNITSYSNLTQTFQINGATFKAGTAAAAGDASVLPTAGGAAQTVAETVSLPSPDKLEYGQPGPFPAGTLTTPDVTVDVVAPASGAMTLNAFQLTTQVRLNNAFNASVTCAIPTTVIMTIPVSVGATTSPTTTPATTSPTTTPATTSPTTTPATTSPTTTPATTSPTTTPETTSPTTTPATTSPTTTPATTSPTTTPETTSPTTTPATTSPTTTPETTSPTTTPATTSPTTTPATTSPTTASTTTSTTIAPTTTTVAPTTTTTVPLVQEQIAGSSTDQNNCHSVLDPPVSAPSDLIVPVTFSTNAFPQPHEGDPITLSNTKVGVSIPADTLQVGVDTGLITDGMQIPSVLKAVINGSSTTEGSQSFSVNSTVTVHVTNGKAQPLSATVSLNHSTWHPKNKTDPVIFTEKSATIISTIDLGGGLVITATFTCAPSKAPPFVALSASGPPPSTTTTISALGSTTTVAGATTTTVAKTTTSGTLPRTGGQVLFLLVIAAALIDVGLGLWAAARPRRRTA